MNFVQFWKMVNSEFAKRRTNGAITQTFYQHYQKTCKMVKSFSSNGRIYQNHTKKSRIYQKHFNYIWILLEFKVNCIVILLDFIIVLLNKEQC